MVQHLRSWLLNPRQDRAGDRHDDRRHRPDSTIKIDFSAPDRVHVLTHQSFTYFKNIILPVEGHLSTGSFYEFPLGSVSCGANKTVAGFGVDYS